MGPIQSSINQLIFQTALLKSFKEQKLEKEEKKAKAVEDKAAKQDLKAQAGVDKELAEAAWEKKFGKKATDMANSKIQARYNQKQNWQERRVQALERRQDIAAPHKPLPKQGE